MKGCVFLLDCVLGESLFAGIVVGLLILGLYFFRLLGGLLGRLRVALLRLAGRATVRLELLHPLCVLLLLFGRLAFPFLYMDKRAENDFKC